MQEANQHFEVAVIGAGPGGYPAAIRAAQRGKSVALIESNYLGGTCLNVGCIPTKTLLASAEALRRMREAQELGIVIGGDLSFDYAKMVRRKDEVVSKVRKGLEGLIISNNITPIKGFGKLLSRHQIEISGEKKRVINANKIILATGSRPRELFPFDHERILSSDSILELKELPKNLLIIGGGIIGCEFASLYRELGVDVTVIEALSEIIPMEAKNISAHLTKSFKNRGIKVITNAVVEGIDKRAQGVLVRVAGHPSFEVDKVLVAVGRSLNTQGIGLDTVGIKQNGKGAVPVNAQMETNVPGIFAIGDMTGEWQLAHVASHQGLVAADNATGKASYMHYNAVPSVIFTIPEIGTVGMTLEKAVKEGHNATLGAFPFSALGKSQAAMQTEGFAQIVIDKDTGQLLGAQVMGHEAAALVAEMAVAIANELTIESISETIHAHPTIAEAWLEAAYIASELPLHLPPKKPVSNKVL